ncbi:MAG: hypothetical protein ACOCYO_10850 [Bacteroidota bacterium]
MEGINILSTNTFGASFFSDGKTIGPMTIENPKMVICASCQKFFWRKDNLLETESTEDSPKGRNQPEKNKLTSKDDILNSTIHAENPYLIADLLDLNERDNEKNEIENFKKEIAEYRKDNITFKDLLSRPHNADKWTVNLKTENQEKTSLPYLKYPEAKDLQKSIEEKFFGNDQKKELYLRKSHWHEINYRIISQKEVFHSKKEELFWEENLKHLLKLLNPKITEDCCLIAEIHRNLGNFQKSLDTLNTIHGEKYSLFKEILTNECKKENRWVVELKE